MGSGAWSSMSFNETVKARGFKSFSHIMNDSVQSSFSATCMDSELNPYKVVRECVDTEEHPNTIPVMLCVDCTGSMSHSLKSCFANLDKTITGLLENFKDVEICVAGIGDFSYDEAPFQVSQYESDNRILDWLLKIWQERGGGGNRWESYTAPWYFGLHHTKLDCWKRGKKGIIITLGDEGANPYLPRNKVNKIFGDNVQADVDTRVLYREASEKFDIYHIAITDETSSYNYHMNYIQQSWPDLLGQHFLQGTSEELPELIKQIVSDSVENVSIRNENGEISW